MMPLIPTRATSTRSKRYSPCTPTLPVYPSTLFYVACQLTYQTLESYDADSYATVDYLLSLPTCTGLIGSTGMCLGGHLAVRASVSPPSQTNIYAPISTSTTTIPSSLSQTTNLAARPPNHRLRLLLRNRHPLPHPRPLPRPKHLIHPSSQLHPHPRPLPQT